MTSILSEISKKELSYTKTEKIIGDHILKLKEKIISYSTFDLAKELGVSQSAIMKFVKKTSGVGFTEFKILLSKEYENQKKQNILLKHDSISLTDSLEVISKTIISESVFSLTNTIAQLDMEDMENCIDIINNSKRVFLIGMGSSALPASDLASKLIKVGITAIWSQDIDSIEAAAFSATEEDTFLIFSYRGKTKKTLEISEIAKSNKAKIIVVTKNTMSEQSAIADKVISIISNETELRTAAMSSKIVFFSIVDILFLGIIKKDLKRRMKIIRDTYDLLKKDKL